MLTEPTTRVNGWMTNSTGTVLNLGPMGLVMKGCTLKAKKREKGVLRLLMVAIMKDSLSRMKLADTETTTGLMASPMRVTGPRIKWTARECSPGKTARSTKVILSTISVKAMVLSYGLMADNILVNGRPGSSTASALISARTDYKSKVNGKMDARSDGSAMTMARTTSKTIDAIFLFKSNVSC